MRPRRTRRGWRWARSTHSMSNDAVRDVEQRPAYSIGRGALTDVSRPTILYVHHSLEREVRVAPDATDAFLLAPAPALGYDGRISWRLPSTIILHLAVTFGDLAKVVHVRRARELSKATT